MADVRKIAIIFVIAVLFVVLIYSTNEAIYPRPKYDDFCKEDLRAKPLVTIGETKNYTCPEYEKPSEEELQECLNKEGRADYNYDEYGCPTKFECEMCGKYYDDAREKHNFVMFLVYGLAGLVAVVLGLFLPKKKNELHEWIGTGFMLGGLMTIFIGTASYFGDMHRILRPFVILVEMIIVLIISYKKFSSKKKK